MNLFVLAPIIVYIFAWSHLVCRLFGSARQPNTHHGEYLLDLSCCMSDILSWAIVVFGTVILPFAII